MVKRIVKMLFVIEIPINYTPGAYKIKKAKDLLEDTATRKNIDLSHDLSLLVNGIEILCHLDYNESPISTCTFTRRHKIS
jgi:hypothetical protein